MRERYEEEPEPDQEPDAAGPALSLPVPTVTDGEGGRNWHYRTDLLTPAEMIDGETLVAKLAAAAEDSWELAGVYPAGERHVLLLRKPRKVEREARRVGFAPPGR
ncbi:MAG: hypothetical protein M3Y62_02095 [Candidatus Dormibacteraeota bacterium]|uniref:hypothetical protein n=1 Tax=Candidatus Dormibacter sp. TaxID=2973982 RepID=UPI0026CB5B3A|nr:hypothetical protein [Candidatus Dormibacteraeota bacterium]